MNKKSKSLRLLFQFSVWTSLGFFALAACSPQSGNEQAGSADGDSTSTTQSENTASMKKEPFGKTGEGTPVDLYTLSNGKGMTVKITNYGGIVTSIVVPDSAGNSGDVVLGFDSLSGYLKEHPYFGAAIGRYGNRIAKGRFKLDGKEYKLATNNGPNHLHGGLKGFDKVVWQAKELNSDREPGLQLTYLSKDGEEGYPGNLSVTIVYTLTQDNALKIDYTATTDQVTPVNLTNHSYFNLAAGKAQNALQHEFMIDADRYTVVDATLIPTGELRSVKGTPFDFTTPHTIGERLGQVEGGYDHNYVLNHPEGQFSRVVRVHDPLSGRVMEVYTDQPGIQVYSGNFLDGSLTGKGGIQYVKHYAFCLETQHFPDSPNQPTFPSTLLKPGETYRTTTTYKFSMGGAVGQ